MNTPQVKDALRQEIQEAIAQLGQNAVGVQSQLDAFLTSIEPELDEAIVLNDVLSLNLIRDRIASKLGAITIGLINKERVLILSVITAVLRTIVRVAIGTI